MAGNDTELTVRSGAEVAIILLAAGLSFHYFIELLAQGGRIYLQYQAGSPGPGWQRVLFLLGPYVLAVLTGAVVIWGHDYLARSLVTGGKELETAGLTPVVCLRLVLLGLGFFYLLKGLSATAGGVLDLLIKSEQDFRWTHYLSVSGGVVGRGLQGFLALLVILFVRPLSDWLMNRGDLGETRKAG